MSKNRSVFIALLSLVLIAGAYQSLKPSAVDKSDLIVVESPKAGDGVLSPLVVKGQARGNWFFEASFPVFLKDDSDQVIAQGIATAKGEWMTTEFVPFEATLEFSQQVSGRNGVLILQKDNPSGLAEHDDSIAIPVFFQ